MAKSTRASTELVKIPASDLPVRPAPKPSKREIIEAMMIRAKEQHDSEKTRVETLVAAALVPYQVRLLKVALERLKHTTPDNAEEYTDGTDVDLGDPYHSWGNGVHDCASVTICGIPLTSRAADPELRRLAAIVCKLHEGSPGHFDAIKMKKKITESLDTCNPARLLEDADALRSIDGLLARVTGKKTPLALTVDV